MTATTGSGRRRTKLWIALGGLVVVVALVGGGIWWFLRDDAPEAVNLEDAVADAESAASTTTAADGATESPDTTAGTDTTAAPDTTAATDAPAADGIAGTWVVDTSIGSFDFESADGTFAGFRVEEELSTIGSTTAVGRTGDVAGSIEIEGTTLVATEIEVTTATLTTNDSRRDDNVWSALETDTFPTATFVLTEPVELGEAAAGGDAISVDATGELTIKGVTQPVTITLEAQLVGDVVAVVGSTPVVFSDYGVEVPSAPIVLSVDDNGVIEFQLLLTRG